MMDCTGYVALLNEILKGIGLWLDEYVDGYLQSVDSSVLGVSLVVLAASIAFYLYIQVNKSEQCNRSYGRNCDWRHSRAPSLKLHRRTGRHGARRKQKAVHSYGSRNRIADGSFTWVIASSREISRTPSESLCYMCKRVHSKRGCSYKACRVCCQGMISSICQAHRTGELVALEQITTACREKHIQVDVSYTNLKNCPLQLGYVGSQLTSLNLSNNRLNSLPMELGLLRGLKEIFLQYNCLNELPDCIGNLDQLQELDCKNNQLRRLPSTIGNLKKLVVLNLTNNFLSELPENIGQIKYLEELCVHSNKLKYLPNSLCNLINLRDLYAGENHQLRRLPYNFGNLIHLTELDVSSCALESLPDSFSNCTSLAKVWFSHNRLKCLPSQIGRLHQLKELHICSNHLQYFPATLSYLQLYTFRATNNPLLSEADREKCERFRTVPRHSLPPLQELAARTMIVHQLVTKYPPDMVPRPLRDKLGKFKLCSCCGGPFVEYFKSELCFATVFIFHRLPLYQQICSPHLNDKCQAVKIAQSS